MCVVVQRLLSSGICCVAGCHVHLSKLCVMKALGDNLALSPESVPGGPAKDAPANCKEQAVHSRPVQRRHASQWRRASL